MLFTAVLLSCSLVEAASLGELANPIRKVVTLLQDMQKEIEAEGEAEEKAFDKFMCYCDGSSGDMQKGASEGAQKIDELSSKLEALKAEKTQLEQELKQHKSDRAQAKQDQEKAQSLRTKENGEFTAAELDMSKNIAAMKGAVAALEKGLGSFMQMPKEQSQLVQRLISTNSDADDFQKQEALAMLQGGSQAQGSTDAIVGMLKAMQEEMEGDLKSAQDTEAAAVASFQELSAAKASEIEAATAAIESKTERSGQVAVEVVQTADDLEDTQADVAETQKFLGDLAKQCSEKKAEWSERQKLRAEEVAAVGLAIKVLNDDDALDLFKKTINLDQQDLGFLQKSASPAKALQARQVLISLAQKSSTHETQLSLIAAALRSKAVDFSKIISMIDGMVDVLGKEQGDDDSQKAFCEDEFDKSAAQKKETEGKLESLKASLEEMDATVETLSSEVKTLQDEIVALDKAVAEATTQRKSEHEAFLTSQSENQACTQLIEKAKNVLNKFYRPNLYKAPPKRELTQEEKILAASGRSDLIPTDAPQMIAGTSISVYAQVRRSVSAAVPPPPPETFGAYQKKDGKSNGVMALMDQMINDLKADMTDAKHAEETAQADYERLMKASQETRAANADSITQKEADKASWSEKIEAAKEEQLSSMDALEKVHEYIAGLHSSCDFLVENYDLRKTARTNEIEGLKNAKAVLSGANFS